MIGPCPAAIAPETLASDVLASADCLIAAQVEQGYATLLAPGGAFTTALTIGLTIYVAIFGYRLLLGLSRFTLGEVVPHFIKIGLVLALVTSWPSYQVLVFDLLFNGPIELANTVTGPAAGAGSGGVLAGLQAVFDRLADFAGDAWAQVPPPPVVAAAPAAPAVPGAAVAPIALPALPFSLGAPQFVAMLLWLSALLLLGMSVGVLLVARIILALLLVLGPLFIALALFRTTRGLAEGWLRVTAKFALVPLFTLPMIAAVVAVLGPVTATLGDVPITSVRDGPALLILLVVVVFAAVMLLAARLGGGIAGSIRLPRGAAPASGDGRAATVVEAVPTAQPVLLGGRAETIVRAIGGGDRRAAVIDVQATPVSGSTRIITAGTAAQPGVADNGNRLGQGYRRLVIGSTAFAPGTR